ncbi:hypothetical protein V8F20_001824 [Naviculisporaceae sp. PSN 640]
MPRRLVRGLRPQQEQLSDVEVEAPSLPGIRKRKRDTPGTDSGYQTEDSSYEEDSESRRRRPRPSSINYWSPAPASDISSVPATTTPEQELPEPAHVPAKPQFRGHALVLCFKDTDLPNITEEICEAFRSIQCTAETIYMDSDDFEAAFEKFLNMESSQPRIIYVSSHGVGTAQDKLDICSYGSEDGGMIIPWSKIQLPIDRAPCDVLTILTCCHGGLAKITSSTPHAKELITTASWSESTFAYLGSSAMKIALNRWYWASSELTGLGLHDILTRVIKEIREDEIRKGHNHVSLLEDRSKSLEEDISRLERELRELRGGTPPPAHRATASKKARKAGCPGNDFNKVDKSGRINKRGSSPDILEGRDAKTVEAMIKTQKRLLKEVLDEKRDAEEIVQEDKKYYTQPHFMRAERRIFGGRDGDSLGWRF